jgi:benzil reductase ((S)-benzoin forming)
MSGVWKKHNKALVTGTGSGIGLALVRRLLFMEYEVYGIGRTLAPELEDQRGYHHYTCDLTDFDALSDTMNTVIGALPAPHRLDIVLLNAGRFCDGIRKVSETDMGELLEMQKLNCFVNKVILDALIAAEIEMPLCTVSASIAGKRMRAGNGGYALSKATLNAMMELYALEHPQTFFAVIGLCVVDTFLSNRIGTLPLPCDPVFEPQAKLRERAQGANYIVTPNERANHLISLLLPKPDHRITSGTFVEVRELLKPVPTVAAIPLRH